MANKIVILLITFFTFGKVYCGYEKIKYFLTNYEITNSTNINPRMPKFLLNEDAEKSIQIKAFRKTFTLDLILYYPREDSETEYISKLHNITDSFLSVDVLLHYGSVRGVTNSYVVGYFSNDNRFRGYVITDEVYCIEPYGEKESLIVYRFKDVIVPGCSKTTDSKNLDCSETMYFTPWKANKPPKKEALSSRYSLFYDKYFELFNRHKAGKTDEETQKKQPTQKAKAGSKGPLDKTGHRSDTNKSEIKKKEGKDKFKNEKKNKENLTDPGKEAKKEGKDKFREEKKNKENLIQSGKDEKKEGSRSNDNFYYLKNSSDPSDQTDHSDDRNKTRHEAHDKEHSDDRNKTRDEVDNKEQARKHNEKEKDKKNNKQDKHEAKNDTNHEKDDDEDDEDDNYVKSKENVLSQTHIAGFENDSDDGIPISDLKSAITNLKFIESSGLYKEYLRVDNEKLDIKESFKNEEAEKNSPIMEAMEDNVKEIQCSVEMVISPSFTKKLGDNTWQDIYTQITLLNRILRKINLRNKGSPVHFTLSVVRMVTYGDEVYSPFKQNMDLEYFTKFHQQPRQFCLCIGLVNEFLKSGQLFDGYIPEGGGGACANRGNTLLISHGSDDTPAPMALYFAALVRGVTRELGANDRDSQCDQGSYPNPMKVLEDYLLTKKISLDKEYSIFTACNVQEVDKAMRGRACFLRIDDPLCGNGILDQGEECDCGPRYHCNRVDPCCNEPHTQVDPKDKDGSPHKGCTLIKGAKCGTAQPCCSGCQINEEKSLCLSGSGACDIATCDGKSADCPSGAEATDGVICSDYNETMSEPLVCKDSKCEVALCTGHGLSPCSCGWGMGKDCEYCCMKEGKCMSAGTQLKLMGGKNFFKPDGVECMGGQCISGKCSHGNGMNQILNRTISAPPMFSAKANGCGSLSALDSLVGAVLCVLLTLILL